MNSLVRTLFLLLTTFSVFNNFFNWLSRTRLFDYSDELLLLFCLGIFVASALQKKKLAILYIAIPFFLVYSFFISWFFGLNGNLLEVFLQSIVNIKFFIILVAFVILFKNHIDSIESFYIKLIIFVGLTLAAHLILGTKFNSFFHIATYSRPNVRYTGLFRHPNHLAYLAVLFIALLLNSFKRKGTNISLQGWIKILLAIIAIVLADTRTAMLAIAILITGFYWDYIYKDVLVFFSFLFIGVVAVFAVLLFTDLPESIVANIEMSYSLRSNYIRGLMLFMSFLIFYIYFPIGTGAGTFGSIFAKDSQVYKNFGVADRYYFVEEWGIYDSNVASILGEYGLIGILLYILLFKASLLHLKHNFGGVKRATMLKPLLWVFVFFCISNPMITNSVYILLSVPVFLIIAKTD